MRLLVYLQDATALLLSVLREVRLIKVVPRKRSTNASGVFLLTTLQLSCTCLPTMQVQGEDVTIATPSTDGLTKTTLTMMSNDVVFS